MDNRIVFTDWNEVVVKTGDEVKEYPTSKYLKELEKRIYKTTYVLYDEKSMTFTIVDKGERYSVKLPDNSQNSMVTKEYTTIFSTLLEMVKIKERLINKAEIDMNRRSIIKDINSSNYDGLTNIQELELYLEYLEKECKGSYLRANTAINTKKAYLRDIIATLNCENSDNLENDYLSQDLVLALIRGLFNQSAVLSDDNRKIVLSQIEPLLLEYKKIGDKHYAKENGFFVEKPRVPKELLTKIAGVKALITELQQSELRANERGGK